MEHKGTVRIETDRLILRRFTEEDAEGVFKNWASDNEVTKFLRWPSHKDIDASQNIIKEWISDYPKADFYQWAIELKELGEPIGSISVVDKNERTDCIHIGYCIGRKWWHQGITSEAFGAVISFLFNEVGANRIESEHDPNNPNSGGVMKKCGLKYEGTLRQADFNNQGIVDVCIYGLLKEEWETGR